MVYLSYPAGTIRGQVLSRARQGPRRASSPSYAVAAPTRCTGHDPCRSRGGDTSDSPEAGSWRLSDGTGGSGESIEIMRKEVVRDLASCGEPDPVVVRNVGECVLEGCDTIGLPHQIRVEWDAHYGSGICTLLIEAVELALDDVAIGARR